MQTDPLSAVFSALADPMRREILARLALGETTVTERRALRHQPSGHFLAPQGSRGGRLISRSREAQWRPRKLEPENLKSVSDWLDQYRLLWEAWFDRLDDYLSELRAQKKE